jgi:alpha-glucosidase
MLLALRGTVFLYYGEEIGMRDVAIPFFGARDKVGRDQCRTPMQWSAGNNGGFSRGDKPWLPLGDCDAINVERQTGDARSMLSFYRRLIRLRRATPALPDGAYRTLPAPDDCLVFARERSDNRVMVAINFSAAERRIAGLAGTMLLSTNPDRGGEDVRGELVLSGDEAVIVKASS